MLELLPISFTFTSLVKILIILGITMFLGKVWYSPIGFQKQWMNAMQWKEGDCDECHTMGIVMANLGSLLSSMVLNILLIAFNIRKHQYLSAMLAAGILCGFYAFNGWNRVFFSKNSNRQHNRTLYLLDIGHMFVLYSLVSLVLVSF
ncbi:unnamed protein product [Rotaria sp. Silwood1]|nr:unnamed protein product [Rotaria sp. Silwood1]CAF1327299.1 unnamed protein product [Rotaria sp. Silwood1]CAF3536358.1 unnamed protein product [Rotaria sp. Silwood1]CAF3645654.1 unnamed protein product [Rotaria sp. Silwood1]CAF4821880.1 unnamed protein product [Rotaria sp. Silwood1]